MKIVGGKWSNWSGGVSCKPRAVVAPKDEVELAASVRKAEGTVRVPGTGHSFTSLNETDGVLIDLAAFTGLRRVDREAGVVTLGAATPIWQVGPLIHPEGFGLKNQGDIDRQTLGGVVGTGTHGTGPSLGSFSAEVAGFRLLLASGEVLNCTPKENAEVFEAGRLSLGLLGVMTEISIRARPAYKLVEKQFLLPIDELFEQLDLLIASNKHFEFFWFPYAERAVCKTLNESTDDAPAPRDAETMRKRGEAVGWDSRVFAAINEVLPYMPFLVGPAHTLFSQLMPSNARARWSHEIYPSPRPIRFNEMEYAVAVGDGPECLKAVAAAIRKRHVNTGFPIEYRTVAQDDVWLSPFYKRPSATIAVHQYHRVNTDKLFGPCEAVFRRFEGRPHWGKRHTRTQSELRHLYPEFDRFRELRRKLDPRGKFLNAYLKELFE
jgi:FAD-linked oxidoreductase